MRRIALVLVGFFLGNYISSTHGQNIELQQLMMASEDKQRQQEIAEQKRANLEADFTADQKEFQFNYETAILWNRLAQDQDRYFAAKWNKSQQDIGLHLEIHLLKQELQRRGKQADKFLKR